MAEGLRVRHPGARQFDDPGVLRLRMSAWATYEKFAPQWNRGQRTDRAPKGTRPRAEADPAELAKLMEELGL
jgi:hypothetical protein